jgi:hypothetical protein
MRLIDQATPIPARSQLRVTLAATSAKQSRSNLLYLDLPPLPRTARLGVGSIRITVPVLRNVISR